MIWIAIMITWLVVGILTCRVIAKGKSEPDTAVTWVIGIIVSFVAGAMACAIFSSNAISVERRVFPVSTPIAAIADASVTHISGVFVFGSGSFSNSETEVYRYAVIENDRKEVRRVVSDQVDHVWFDETTTTPPRVTFEIPQSRYVWSPWVPRWVTTWSWVDEGWTDILYVEKPTCTFTVPPGTVIADFKVDLR